MNGTVHLLGQDSYLLRSNLVDLAITRVGGMLAPVTFFPDDPAPIQPYAIAPWAQETLAPGTTTMLAALRGDWFCSAFGENAESYEGRQLPPHGETANSSWHELDRAQTRPISQVKLGMDLPLQGGRCESTTTLVEGHSVIYQRHDLTELTAPCNPGHHATLAFPDDASAGALAFSRLKCARTYIEPLEQPASQGFSCLEPNLEISDLHAVRCVDGSTTDLCRYPARRGFEDIVMLCADTTFNLAWSSVTFPNQGYVWFSLRSPKLLNSTLLWFSNGGRHAPPWNGRHVNVMGIEDVTAFFHVGAAASCRENLLSVRGIPTHLLPDSLGRLSIPYIQGVARIPVGFDRLAQVGRCPRRAAVRLKAASGVSVEVACCIDFLQTGTFPGIENP